MTNVPEKLEKFGFDKRLLETVAIKNVEQFEIARVTAVHRDSYTVSNGEVGALAELVGKIIFSASSPVDYPAVGDWVFVTFYDENTFAIIHEVFARKSLLKRKSTREESRFSIDCSQYRCGIHRSISK